MVTRPTTPSVCLISMVITILRMMGGQLVPHLRFLLDAEAPLRTRYLYGNLAVRHSLAIQIPRVSMSLLMIVDSCSHALRKISYLT